MRTNNRPLLAALAALAVCFTASLAAQSAPYEGRLETRTEHFRFIYEPRDRAAVEELVTYADEVYRNVTAYFDHRPRMIDVIVNGRTDFANGSFAPAPNRITLYVASPTENFLGARTESWLKAVFTHELTHYVHLTDPRGLFGTISRFVGEFAQLLNWPFMPGWMVEGITTDRETAYTEGGRGRSVPFEMTYKAPILEDRLFSLAQAAYMSDYPPSGRIYVAGNMLVRYLNETYGDDTFARIYRRFIDFPLLGPWGAIKHVTGKSGTELFEEMKTHYRHKFASSAGIPDGRLVSPDVWGDYAWPVKAGGVLYAYRATFDEPPAIVRIEPETGEETVVLEAALFDGTSFTLNDAADRLVFASYLLDGTHPSGGELTADLDAFGLPDGRVKRLTENAHLFQPALSPDGSRLVAVRREGSYHVLVEVDQRDGSWRPIFTREQVSIANPVFSPDGTRIAFTMNARGMQDVWILELPGPGAADGAEPAAYPLVTTDFAGEYFPRWKDNRTVTFSSDRGGALSLYEAELPTADGSGGTVPTRLRTETVSGGRFAEDSAGPGATIVRVLEDPIGALSGMYLNGALVYESYTSLGSALKLKPASALERVPVTVRSEELPAPIRFETEFPARPYIDLPKPYLHLPYPAFKPYVTETEAIGYNFGIGFTMMGASPLGRSVYSFSGEFMPATGQPALSFGLTVAPVYPFMLSYQVIQDYLPDFIADRFTQTTFQTLSAEYLALDRNGMSSRGTILFGLGLTHTFRLERDEPFSFIESFGTGGTGREHLFELSGGVGFSYLVTNRTPRTDLYRPEISGTVSASVPISGSRGGFTVRSVTEAVLPPIIPHTYLKLGLKGSFISAGHSAGAHRISPRGSAFGFSIDRDTAPAAGLAAADWFLQSRPLDLPLLFGFYTTRVFAGLHLEWEFGIGSGGFVPGGYLYPGFELGAVFGNNLLSGLPLGLGVSFRLDHAALGRFDPARDIGVYITLSLNSFTGTGAGTTEERALPAGTIGEKAAR